MIVYKLTFSNGKAYIGQTVRMLDVRFAQHAQAAASGSLLPVHCAWRKHGIPAALVLSHHDDLASLHAAEIEAIARCGTLVPHGYNLGFGGETAPSKNPDVAAKIAAKAKGRCHSGATRAKMAQASTQRWNDPAYRDKVAAGVAVSWTDERKAAIGRSTSRMWEARRASGWEMPAETRAKITAAKAEMSDETRQKMSASAKARVREPRTDSTRTKIAASTAASWQNPEVKARRAAAIREGHRRRREARNSSREG